MKGFIKKHLLNLLLGGWAVIFWCVFLVYFFYDELELYIHISAAITSWLLLLLNKKSTIVFWTLVFSPIFYLSCKWFSHAREMLFNFFPSLATTENEIINFSLSSSPSFFLVLSVSSFAFGIVSNLLFHTLSLFPFKRLIEKFKNNPEWIEKSIVICQFFKYLGLIMALLSAGFAFRSQEEEFATSAAYLGTFSGVVGITSEGVKELLLEPQRKRLESILPPRNFNSRSSTLDTYVTAQEN